MRCNGAFCGEFDESAGCERTIGTPCLGGPDPRPTRFATEGDVLANGVRDVYVTDRRVLDADAALCEVILDRKARIDRDRDALAFFRRVCSEQC